MAVYKPKNTVKAKSYTPQELLEAAQKLKDYCEMIHYDNPKYKGGYNCDYCVFAEKSIRFNKDSWCEPQCLLKDDFKRSEPQFWRLDKVEIEEPEPSLF